MKKIFGLLAFIFVIFLAGCSNPQGSVLTSQDNTLRSAVQGKNENIVWTKEIEPDMLNTKLNTQFNISNKGLVSPQFLNSIKTLQPAVYPEIKGFASVDSSAMNEKLFTTISNLCDTLCKGTENLNSFFDSEYFYNCVFFTKDFNDSLKEQYKNKKIPEKLFERYLICKGFEGNELIQVPVRFYTGKETLDLSVFLTYHGDYKVIQIEILGWGKQYGESEKKE